MRDDGGEQAEKFAGAVVFRVQVVAFVAFGFAVAMGVMAFEKRPDLGLAAGLMMIASALAMGLLVNAVLRR